MQTDVAENLKRVLGELPHDVRLVAVSKFHPNEYIEAAYKAGQRVFGESHEQELQKKWETLPRDIEWHFIGHLQTNKVKYIVPYISLIESVDSQGRGRRYEVGTHAGSMSGTLGRRFVESIVSR